MKKKKIGLNFDWLLNIEYKSVDKVSVNNWKGSNLKLSYRNWWKFQQNYKILIFFTF